MKRINVIFCKIVVYAIFILPWFMPGAAFAVTGDITASPHHLVIDSNQLGSTTISWSTAGTSTAQVWVSFDGGAESLMASGASGSVNVGWIRTEKIYIFSLYEGTSHTNLLNWMSVITREPPANRLGFNYWAYKGTCQDLINLKWTDAKKDEVKKDLDQMASYGTIVLRLMFWPQFSGYKLVTGGGGGYFTSDFNEIKANLPELLGFCAQRGLKVIISFGNNYRKNGPNPPIQCWWDLAYGTDHNAFLVDSATWIAGYVNAIENSQYSDVVLYYDIENELNDGTRYTWVYARYMYDNISIPKGKIGLNPQRAAYDCAIARTELGNRRIDYIDFHTYPDLTNANNKSYIQAYSDVTASFPDSVLVVGEYAGMGPDPQDLRSTDIEPSTEQTQQNTEVNFINWAFANNIPYFCHWHLWDSTPNGSAGAVAGWGYSHHAPKDVMGKMAEMLSIVPNGDMENLNGIQPAYWTADGNVPVSFVYHTASATNLLCARLRISQSSGSGWIQSDKVAVEGGQKLFLNCYIRTSMDNVYMGVREYDSGQNLIAANIGPRIASPLWQWYNYLHVTIPWSVILEAKTRYIEVVIGGNVRNNPSLLDVDTVSVWESNLRTVKADFTSDRTVSADDLEALVQHWLTESYEPSWDPKFNIASPPDEIINFNDFSAFGLYWLWQ